MELWIRSQNKGALIKVEMLGNEDGTIHSYLGVNKTVLGKYKSNERALEILDEIQQILCPKKPKAIIGKNVEFIPALVYVYEMPED